MRSPRTLRLKSSLSPVLMALALMASILAAPCAFAKKDLFANDPASNQKHSTENLVSSSSSSLSSSSSSVSTSSLPHSEESSKPADIKVTSENEKDDRDENPSYLESQFTRFKGHLVEVKEDLFGGKKTSSKKIPSNQLQQEQNSSESSHSSDESLADVPTISSAQAAQRAQTFAEGQVINVRKYRSDTDGKICYAVKLLQKSGRMKTITLDAINGNLAEEESTQ